MGGVFCKVRRAELLQFLQGAEGGAAAAGGASVTQTSSPVNVGAERARWLFQREWERSGCGTRPEPHQLHRLLC